MLGDDEEDVALSDLVDACDVLVKTHYGGPEPRYGMAEAIRDLRRALAAYDREHPDQGGPDGSEQRPAP